MSPAKHFSKEDFPDPLAPNIAVTEPEGTEALIPFKISEFLIVTERFLISMSINFNATIYHEPKLILKQKKGAPRNAVMTPIGSSAGAIATLAIISVKTKKVPPKKNENGIINL